MFVHDFVHVDRPLADIIGRFGPLADPWLGALVVAAWADIRDDWAAAGVEPGELAVPAGLRVSLGLPRFRDDGLIIPVSWPVGDQRFVPGLEADLELVSFGADRTHVQLLGRYRFAPGVDRWTREGSLAHRITVAGVRRFLELLAAELEREFVAGSSPERPRPVSRRMITGVVMARHATASGVRAPHLDPGPDQDIADLTGHGDDGGAGHGDRPMT